MSRSVRCVCRPRSSRCVEIFFRLFNKIFSVLQVEPGARVVVAGWGASPEGGLTAARLQGDIARLSSHWSRTSNTVF